jgi:hypothetical protein
MELEKALDFFRRLKRAGFKGELVGGAFKGKQEVHDLDLICLDKDLEYNRGIVEEVKGGYYLDRFGVELYYCSKGMYKGLRKALRATTYESIQGRLMKGLKFSKVRC